MTSKVISLVCRFRARVRACMRACMRARAMTDLTDPVMKSWAYM